jgi:hypothetical protein
MNDRGSDSGSDKTAEPDTDRLAWELFRLLRDRSADDRLYVYRALTARLSAGPTSAPERVTLAVNALATCMETIGKAPSRRSYDQWRASQERPSEWPSATSIRNLFGSSWAKALDALGVKPAPDVLARRLLNIGRGYTEDDCLAAIGSCVEALMPKEQLTFGTYHEWAQRELADASRPKQRLPLSSTVFCKHWGSWVGALTKAGFPELLPKTGGHKQGTPRGTADKYSDENVLDFLRQAAQETKQGKMTKKLTMTGYDRWREAKIEAGRECGEVIFVPSVQVPLHRYGSWPRALHAAGLATEDEARLAPQQGTRRLTDEEVIGCVVAALSDIGYPTPDSANGWKVKDEEDDSSQPRGDDSDRASAKAARPTLWLTRADYNRWRRERLLRADYPGLRVCGDQLIRQRLGAWVEVIALANKHLEREQEGRSHE